MSMKKALSNKKSILLISAVLLFFGVRYFLNLIYTPVIIMYHSVGERGTIPSGYRNKLNVEPAIFERQMKFLRDNNYNVITLEEFVKRIKQKKPIPRKTIAITFDDGLKNNYLNAYRVLKKYELPATVFVITGSVSKENFMTWEDMRKMDKTIITIGSHTQSHAYLPSLDSASVRRELKNSKEVIEKNLGVETVLLSYPLGAFTEEVKKIARETGYIGAVATNPKKGYPKNDPYALKRIRISESSKNMFVFWLETSGYYTFIKEIRDED